MWVELIADEEQSLVIRCMDDDGDPMPIPTVPNRNGDPIIEPELGELLKPGVAFLMRYRAGSGVLFVF